VDKAKRNEYLAIWRENNRDKTRAAQAKYYSKNKELCGARVKESVAKNRPYYSMKTTLWQKENRERHLATKRGWYQRHRGEDIARVRKRQGSIRQALYLMSPAERVEVEGMYLFCSVFPKFEVDHIIPLNGKNVSGLHVLGNLQVLSRFENRSKGNKFNMECTSD
jgi:hypothetical protein